MIDFLRPLPQSMLMMGTIFSIRGKYLMVFNEVTVWWIGATLWAIGRR